MARPRLKVATGVLLTEDHLTVTTVAKTALGARQISTQEVEIGEQGVVATLGRLRTEGALKGKIVCGVDARRSFAITRKLISEDAGQTPAELLSARLGYLEGGLVAAMDGVRLPSGQFVSLVACSRGLASELLAGLDGIRISQIRLAPVMPALYRMAQQKKSAPRKWKCEMRVLIGEGEGLAILAYQGHPVASRLFDFPDSKNTHGVEVAVLSLMTFAREELALNAVDGVFVHVADTEEELVAACERGLGVTTKIAPAVSTDAHAGSYALGLAGLKPKPGATDLFQEIHPPAGLKQNFPAKAALVLGAVVVGSGWAMNSEADSLEREAARIERAAAANAKRAGAAVNDLRKVHEGLKAEMGVAKAFLFKRVFWSEILYEIPEVLPETVMLTDFDGRDLLRFKKAKGTTLSRQLQLIGQTKMDGTVVSPPEVNTLTTALAESEVFQANFPLVAGANVRLMPGMAELFARISLLCLPKNS